MLRRIDPGERGMEASEHRPVVLATPVNWLSPSLIVSLSLALLAALLASVYLLQRDPAPRTTVSALPAADAAQAQTQPVPAHIRVDPVTGQEVLEEAVEFRCVQGMRVRKQGSSYSSAGHC
jgi:hypothetical protein